MQLGGSDHVRVASVAHLDPRERLPVGVIGGQARIGVVQIVDHIATEGRAPRIDRVPRHVEGVLVQLVPFENGIEHGIERAAIAGVQLEVVVAARSLAGIVHTRPHHVHPCLWSVRAEEGHGGVDRLRLGDRTRRAVDRLCVEPAFALHIVGIGRIHAGACALLVTAHELLQALRPEPAAGAVGAERRVRVVLHAQLLRGGVHHQEVADRIVVKAVVRVVLVGGVIPHRHVLPAVVLQPAELDVVRAIEHAVVLTLDVDRYLLLPVEQLDQVRVHRAYREARIGQGG